ncbi:hypothetical protein ACFLIM_35640 [Nonomuraea sp. M3C6]|uniref:Nucleotidyl transferase domain-containing protein n=1 Tax=Nonomuraea marmarensis TaxID=3351344 RepID=A0ABW7AQN6_9ACTN
MIAAGGLGARVHPWARYLPKEFLPVQGRPALVHLLEEIAHTGAMQAVTIYHPYYEGFAAWARHAFGPNAHLRYRHRAGLPDLERGPAERVTPTFIAQHGRYGDLTSLLNGADHYAQTASVTSDDELLLAFGHAGRTHGVAGCAVGAAGPASGAGRALAAGHRGLTGGASRKMTPRPVQRQQTPGDGVHRGHDHET